MLNSFTKINVKNFRGFKSASFSFAITAAKNKNLIVVYGQNGAGKSSLARLFDTLRELALMVESRIELSKSTSSPLIKDFATVNQTKEKTITNCHEVIEENKTIGSEGETMELEYSFRLGEKDGIYHVVFSDQKCIEESLSFRLKYRKEVVFHACDGQLSLNSKVFLTSLVRLNLQEEHSRLFGQTSMLGIMSHFVFSSNLDYQKKNFDPALISIISFFSSLSVSLAGEASRPSPMVIHYGHGHLFDLQGEKVSDEYETIRPAIELGLTAFFSSLCFDLESIEYKKTMTDKDERYCLYFNQRDKDGTVISIPRNRLSSGTKRLVSLFFALYNAFLGRTTIIDEVDNGIHDLVIANILSSAIGNEMGQLIFTTHNTLLMKRLPKGCIYFLNAEQNHETAFYSLDDFGRKVQEKTDVVKRYLDGLYGGTPFPNVPSMRIIKEMMDEKMDKQREREGKAVE